MPKYFLLSIICFAWSCTNPVKENDNTIQVSVLRGPSAIAFAQWMKTPPSINGKTFIVKIVDSPELMQASIIKQESDIAVLPMINAVNLYNKGISIKLAGCPIWGTLYIVERETILQENNYVYIFGAGTTPDIISRYYIDQKELPYIPNYSFPTAREVMQSILIGKIDRAVLSEPFLSIALKQDSTLKIVANLNHTINNNDYFPQTAITLTPKTQKYSHSIDSLISVSCKFAIENPKEAIKILEENDIFRSGMLTPQSIERCKIEYLNAMESEQSILNYLQLIEKYEPKAIGSKLPDNDFFIKE